MIHQTISFKTAKLLAQLEVPVFEKAMGYSTCFYEPKTGTLRRLGRTGRNPISKLYYAPSQSLLQKWLREKYELHIEITRVCLRDKALFFGSLTSWNNPRIPPDINKLEFLKLPEKSYKTSNGTSYEEVLEIELLKALKTIKNEVMKSKKE